METAENSPARLPQSVHWKASKNYAYLQVQQMAATAPPHALPVAHGDCLEFTCTVAAICALESKQNYGYLQVQQMAATPPPHSLPVAHGDC